VLHPATEIRFVGRRVGLGVFANEVIPMGTITWTPDPLDQRLSIESVLALGALPPAFERYTFVDGSGARVLCWDNARFVNHSCDPNCLSPGMDLEVAVRDIAKGEQLTNDYTALNLLEPFDCLCESAECRGVVNGQDFDSLAPAWDEQVRIAFGRVGQLPQPLWGWLSEADRVLEILDGLRPLPSVCEHRWTSPEFAGTQVATAVTGAPRRRGIG
jgi:hypothetical protein